MIQFQKRITKYETAYGGKELVNKEKGEIDLLILVNKNRWCIITQNVVEIRNDVVINRGFLFGVISQFRNHFNSERDRFIYNYK